MFLLGSLAMNSSIFLLFNYLGILRLRSYFFAYVASKANENKKIKHTINNKNVIETINISVKTNSN